MIGSYARYWWRALCCMARGSRAYYAWMALLLVLMILGGVSFYHHVIDGLSVTSMSNQVSWGIGIANFVYFVGIAASVALIIVPAYVYKSQDFERVVVLAQILGLVSVLMCLSFITSDLGRPDRLWHLMPVVGIINLPSSHLAWDVLVFSVYLVISLYIPGYLLFKIYRRETPNPLLLLPLVFISAAWAVGIHTVTAFLLSGLKSRNFWNTGLLAPRFLVSAAVSGPALMILIFAAVDRFTTLRVPERVYEYLKYILRFMLPVDVFLLGCEVFLESHSGMAVTRSAHYLYFGLNGHTLLPKLIWTAIVFDCIALVIFITPKYRNHRKLLLGACGLVIFSIWVEKGAGLVFPGFTPSPLGEVVEYAPNASEIVLSLGILAAGAFLFTALAKVAVAVQTGELLEAPALQGPKTRLAPSSTSSVKEIPSST